MVGRRATGRGLVRQRTWPVDNRAVFISPRRMPLTFRNAYYIKLGAKGLWEADSLDNSRMRIGWNAVDLAELNAGAWDAIEVKLRAGWPAAKKGVATVELNRLRDIAESTEEDIWLTFQGATLWWARLKAGPVMEDDTSKYRETLGPWQNRPLDSNRVLAINELPGKLAAIQGFRGTVCSVSDHALLRRVLSGERSALGATLEAQRTALVATMEKAIQALHWKDYESLVDMVFRQAGWQRVSVLGQQDRGYDLDLRDPVLGERYVVQVKSRASRAEFEETITQFAPDVYRKVFFVTHTPSADLLKATAKELPQHVVLVNPLDLAQLAFNAGLVNWVADKVA